MFNRLFKRTATHGLDSFNGVNSTISFTDFKINSTSIFVKVAVKIGEKEECHNLHFKWNDELDLHPEQIALALSTFCVKKYNHIEIHLALSDAAAKTLSNFTGAQITCYRGNHWTQGERSRLSLNFSGGFDSLAAYFLMPEGTKLCSMDFGGKFARERRFFEQFSPFIVSTNLVETGLHRDQWAFMGIGSILSCEKFSTKTHVFGSILEAGVDNFRSNPTLSKLISFPPFALSGIGILPYVSGLTEIGTLMVIGHYAPHLIASSLDSCANDGEEKRIRKQVLAEIVARKTNKNFQLRSVPLPKKPYFPYGRSFAADFLCPYIIRHAGYDVARSMIDDIPEAVIAWAEKSNMNYMERFNSKFIEKFPEVEKSMLIEKLGQSGIFLYDDNDFNDFKEATSLLSSHHKI